MIILSILRELHRATPLAVKVALPVLGLGFVALLIGAYVFVPRTLGRVNGPDQPIDFPHTLHAGTAEGQLGLDCQFCHRTVTTSAQASIPAVEQCMYCHQIIGQDLPEVAKLVAFYNDETPVDWRRVHRMPDHVHFVHDRHIERLAEINGIENPAQVCSICHGDVAGMERVRQVRTLNMGDCMGCHKDNGAPTDCTTCHY